MKKNSFAYKLQRRIARFQFGVEKRMDVYESLRDMVNDGLPIKTAIDTIYASLIKRRGRDPRKLAQEALPFALREWSQSLSEGKGFGNALTDWMPPMERVLIVSAERSSESLSMIFDILIYRLRSRRKMMAAMVKAGIYPIFLITGFLGFLYAMSHVVVPQISISIAPEKLTAGAKFLINASDFVRDNWLFIPPVVITIPLAIVYSMPYWSGNKVRSKLDRFPPYSLFRFWEGTGFLFGLSAMVKTGVPQMAALAMMSDTVCRYTKSRIRAINSRLRAGDNLGEALDTTGHNFPDPKIIDRIVIASTRPSLSETLESIANDWSERGVEKIEGAAAFIFVFGVLIVGMLALLSVMALMEIALSAASLN